MGNTFLQVKSKATEECGGLCAANWQCTHFTWESKGICTLKTAPKLSTEIRLLNGTICGYITEGNSNFQWQDGNKGQEKLSYNCDFPGNDIRRVPVFTKSESCFSRCISEPKCTHYSALNVLSIMNVCSLKTGKSPIAATVAGDVKAYCGMISARI